MLMVIVGAGASFDSSPRPEGTTEAERPPLARALFDVHYEDLLNDYPKARYAVDKLRAAVGRGADVEQELERMRDTADKDPIYHSHLMAVRHYLRDAVGRADRLWAQRHGGVTNYVRLVGQVREWARDAGERVCYVTFNYDLLLDRALEDQLGLRRGLLDTYVSAPHPLIKFHGSVNWFRLCGPDSTSVFAGGGSQIEDVIDHAADLKPAGEIQVWGGQWERIGATTRAPTGGGRDEVMVPALSIPLQRKATEECPRAQVELLDIVIPETTRVLVIGWRGAEEHFWSHWRNRVRGGVRVAVCCGGPDMPDGITKNCPAIGIPLDQITNEQITFTALVDGEPSRLSQILST